MSNDIIFIQSGQCGNQVGYELMNQLWQLGEKSCFNSNENSKNSSQFYSRSVSLDTEPKVIEDCIMKSKYNSKTNKSWQINPKTIAYRHGGAGNNWALGYSMLSGEFVTTSIDLARREIEKCDCNPLLFSIHSMAGGTGSGLGSRMTELLHDEFEELTRVNLAILPYHFGEVVVQNYNAILSLSKIATSSDGIILFENDIAFELCKKVKSIDRPSLHDINQVIANNVAPTLLLKQEFQASSICRTFQDDIIDLCCHPGFRLLDIKTVPQTSDNSIAFTNDTWNTLTRSLLRMQTLGLWSEIGVSKLLSDDSFNRPSCVSLGSVLTFHGEDSFQGNLKNIETIQMSCNPKTSQGTIQQSKQSTQDYRKVLINTETFPQCDYSSLLNLNNPMKLCYAKRSYHRYDRFASLLSNSQAILPSLETSIHKSIELFHVQAYNHQYYKYNVQEEDFIQAFRSVGQIIENYKSLS